MRDIERVDAVIIGTGQAGKPLAGALADAGWRSVIVEQGRVGGTCVVSGCTPSKTMVASARVAHLARRGSDYGVGTGPVTVDLERVRARQRAMVESWSSGAEHGMTRHETLELVKGTASFAGPHEIEVRAPNDLRGTPIRRFQADHVFVNAGGRPRIPELPGLDSTPYLTSTTIMELGRVPEHLIVLGGGFVGLEFAQMFRRFGTRVTVVELRPRLASGEDDDVSEALTGILLEDGIALRLGTESTHVERGGDGIRLHVADGDPIEGSRLLVAAGRVPNTEALTLGAAGLDVDQRGFLPVDDRCMTAVEGVWGLGDVTGAPPFTHVSYDDFRVARSQLLGDGSYTREGRQPIYTVFIDPQLGRVGMSEREARERGLNVRVARLPMDHVARALETDETRGLMKAVVDADTDRILGAAVLGIEGGEIASMIQIAMMGGLPYTALRDGVFSHPTLSESLNSLFASLDPS